MAFAALAGVLLPAVGRALHLDRAIHEYAVAAASFKNLQAEFRRAAEIWSLKPVAEFEQEARRLFKAMADARKPSLTPPDIPIVWLARRKIRKGHYSYDADKTCPEIGVAARFEEDSAIAPVAATCKCQCRPI